MAKVFILLVPALAVITALSCRRKPAKVDRDTARTPEHARIAVENRSDPRGENRGSPCINLNTAGAEALITLPGIGPGLAEKIIQYRTRYGPLQRPQDVIIINGFGEKRYHKIERYVCAS